MDITSLVLLGLGFVLRVAGAETLVRGASHLAAKLGIFPLQSYPFGVVSSFYL